MTRRAIYAMPYAQADFSTGGQMDEQVLLSGRAWQTLPATLATHMLNSCVLRLSASYDEASNIRQALLSGGESDEGDSGDFEIASIASRLLSTNPTGKPKVGRCKLEPSETPSGKAPGYSA
jgi:hypothetical protein